ncbi:protein GOLVEN 7 [Cornus florida]|uniref:protein GOLVEN 7 n=1 Tax=Cornus florida TaxID=4283 RepID=UPI0028A04DB2|nr:protein GOLVEN 7 [Cornus florida]
MVSIIRLKSLFAVLFLITVRLSIVYPQQDGNASREDNAISTGTLLRGRKMVINNVMKLEKVEENAATSKISSEKQRVQEVVDLNGRGEQSVRSLLSKEVEDVAAGFVAFSADYHTPEHHPPKNN